MDNWYLHVRPIPDNSSTDLAVITEDGLLSLAVVLGSSLSLVGLVFAFITYRMSKENFDTILDLVTPMISHPANHIRPISPLQRLAITLSLFSDLRSVAGTTLMNLLASLFLTQLLYVVGAGGVQAADLCVSLALALHYSRLTVVSWLLAATHDLYRTVKSQVGMIDCPPPSLLSSFLKYSLLGWGLPALLLACAVFIQDYDGIGESGATQLRRHNCWFTSNRSFFTAFVLPYWIILAVTIYYIVRGAMAIRWAAAFAPSKKAQEKLTRRRKLQLMLFVRILVFLTLIIMAGAASVIFGSNLAFIVYSCGQAIQGILIALAVCCNCQILKLYTRSIQVAGQQVATAMTTYGSSGQELSKSASLQLLTWDRNPDSV